MSIRPSRAPAGSATLSVVIPARDADVYLPRTLSALRAAAGGTDLDLIVVDDGSRDATARVARSHGSRVVSTGKRPLGPGAARNLGVEHAAHDIVLFVDADVAVHRDAIERMLAAFDEPDIVAAYGAYDSEPTARNAASLYVNIRHHLVHQTASADAHTFWAGLGAVRRQSFCGAGGFDAQCYPRPSIEDIELGARLRARGGRIRRDPAVRGKHLKRWTWVGILRSDVLDRAVPWTRLIARVPDAFGDLNVSRLEQARAALAIGLVVAVIGAGAGAIPAWIQLVPALGAAWTHRRLLALVGRHGGLASAGAALAFHQLYYLYSAAIYTTGRLWWARTSAQVQAP